VGQPPESQVGGFSLSPKGGQERKVHWDFKLRDSWISDERSSHFADQVGFCEEINRVLLDGYEAFDSPIPLSEKFSSREIELRDYFKKNASKGKDL
jgi:hypothetical protein